MSPLARPARDAAYGFIRLGAAMGVIAVACALDLVARPAGQRALGIVVGAMIVLVGNLLPKLRLEQWSERAPATAAAAARTAGWLLVLAGLAEVALFAFTPLEPARRAAGAIGFAVLAILALDGLWLAWETAARPRPEPGAGSPATPESHETRRVAVWLLYAFLYVLVTACEKFLFAGRPWLADAEIWTSTAFWLGLGVLYARLGGRRAHR